MGTLIPEMLISKWIAIEEGGKKKKETTFFNRQHCKKAENMNKSFSVDEKSWHNASNETEDNC